MASKNQSSSKNQAASAKGNGAKATGKAKGKADVQAKDLRVRYECQGWSRMEYFIRSGHVFLGLGAVQFIGYINNQGEIQSPWIGLGLGGFAVFFGAYLMYAAQRTTQWQRANVIRDIVFWAAVIGLAVFSKNVIGLMAVYAFAMITPIVIWQTSKTTMERDEEAAREEHKQRTVKQATEAARHATPAPAPAPLRNMSRAERKKYKTLQQPKK